MKEPKIKKIGEFNFSVNGVAHNERLDFKQDKQELAVCKCGNKTFWVYQPQDQYETNGICDRCYKSYCLHSD